MSGNAQAGGTVFHLEPLGPLAMRMIDFMIAQKFASLVPGCRISNVDIPAWGIHLPAIGSPGTVARQRYLLPVDLASVAAAMRAGGTGRVNWSAYALRLENFLPREHYRGVFAPLPSAQPGYGSEYLVCHLHDETLDGLASDQPLTPVEFIAEVVNQSGLKPVFVGNTAPSSYTLRLRERFPNAAYVHAPDDLVAFETIRRSQNILIGTSVLGWLAAWLSRADNIFMTVSGLFNPMQRPDVDLLPPDDSRFKFFLFPINYAVPLDQHATVHRGIAPFWRLMRHDLLRRQIQEAPRFERQLETMAATFDEDYYLSANSDVAAVVRAGRLPDGFHHYVVYGFQARRFPFPLDASWYAAQYPMAGFEVAQGDYTDFSHHYIAIGKARGYMPLPGGGSGRPEPLTQEAPSSDAATMRADSDVVETFVRDNPIQMADDEINLIVSNIRNGPRDLLFCEWGSGASTIRWLREMSREQKLVSIEHNKAWFDQVRPVVDSSPSMAARFEYHLCESSKIVDQGYGHPFEENPVGLDSYFCPDDRIFDADIFLIDGVARGVCALFVLMRARKASPLIYIHDWYSRQGWYSWATRQFPKTERVGTSLLRLWK